MTVEMIAYLLMILLIVYLGIQLIDKEDMLRNMKVKYQELLGRNSDLEWKYRELESSHRNSSSESDRVFFLCDQRACSRECYNCRHTLNPEHAVHFIRTSMGYMEQLSVQEDCSDQKKICKADDVERV